MALHFPTTPSVNQIYTYNNTSWQWNGSVWSLYSVSTGSQGTQGPAGAAQGTQGTVGIQGTQGAGSVGTQGTLGSSGSQGTQGLTGAGSQGTIGTQGLTGAGSQGTQGTIGSTGTQGLTGAGTQGTQGLTGAGSQGTIGTQGVQGLTGAGSQGTIGTNGPSGNIVPYADATGTDTITATYTPAIISYYDGLYVLLDSAGNNTTTIPTFNPNGIGAKNITRDDGTALIAGDTGPSSYVMQLVYNTAGGGNWRLLNPENADAFGNTGEIQLNSGGILYADPDFIFDTGNNILQIGKTGSGINNGITLYVSNTPASPVSNNVTIFGRSVAGRILPSWVGPSGLDSPVQPLFGRNHVGYMHWMGNSTAAANTIGMTQPTMFGTATARTVTNQNLYQSLRRIGYISTGIAGGSVSLRQTVPQYLRGNTNGQGGFTYITRFGIADAAFVANATMLIGLANATAQLSNANNPLTMQNFIGIGQVPNSNNLSIIGNATNTTAYVLDTGLRCNVGNVNIWDLAMFAAPNSNTVGIQITDMTSSTLNTFSVVLANNGVNMPYGNTLLTVQQFRTNNSTAAAVAVDWISLYLETDL